MVTITVAGDRLIVDFDGSAPQVRGAINSPIPFTKSAVYACVRHLIGGDPPNNEGYFRPIEVRGPAGHVVNPVLPASVAARGLTGFRIANAVFGALAQVAPDRVFACEAGGDTGDQLSAATTPSGEPFVFIEFLYGSLGRPAGPRTASTPAAARSSTSRTTRSRSSRPSSRWSSSGTAIVPDTGGAGKFRGGLALVRDYRFEEAEGDASSCAPTAAGSLPYGLRAGATGRRPRTSSNPGRPRPQDLPTKCRLTVHAATSSATCARAPAAGATR